MKSLEFLRFLFPFWNSYQLDFYSFLVDEGCLGAKKTWSSYSSLLHNSIQFNSDHSIIAFDFFIFFSGGDSISFSHPNNHNLVSRILFFIFHASKYSFISYYYYYMCETLSHSFSTANDSRFLQKINHKFMTSLKKWREIYVGIEKILPRFESTHYSCNISTIQHHKYRLFLQGEIKQASL